MDLCTAYIDKWNQYQELVKRKVKTKQTDDLLKFVNTTRLSEADAKEFFVNFDTAFKYRTSHICFDSHGD